MWTFTNVLFKMQQFDLPKVIIGGYLAEGKVDSLNSLGESRRTKDLIFFTISLMSKRNKLIGPFIILK